MISCKSKNEDVKTKTELLTTAIWKLTGYTISPGIDINGDGVIETDLYNITFPDQCMRNSTFKFNVDSTYVVTNGCTGETNSSTWQFSKDQTVFYLAMVPYIIENLNETNFVTSISYIQNNIEYKQTRTYTAN
jgi:hypothetical protein